MAKKENNNPENELPKGEFLFEKVNYNLLLIGIGVIALGFFLMSGGEGSVAPDRWDESVFSPVKIRVAPTMVLIGFGITIWSILKNPNKKIRK